MEVTKVPAGFMFFESSNELQKFIETEKIRLAVEREKYEPFDIKELLNCPRTKEQEVEWQAEKSKNGDYFKWLNDNRRQYDNLKWEPGINNYLEFFLSKVSQLPYDKLTVDGTYEITSPPPSQKITLPRLKIIKYDLIFDVVHDFGIEPCYLLRIRERIPLISNTSLFISEYSPHPRILRLLQSFDGEQTVLTINTEMDLYAILTILLNTPHFSSAEKEEAKREALEALEALANMKWKGEDCDKSSVELIREMRDKRIQQLSENFTSETE